MAVFWHFYRKIRHVLFTSLVCIVSTIDASRGVNMYPSCPDGSFSVLDSIQNFTYPSSGRCYVCPIGAYDKTNNHYIEPNKSDCRICTAGTITAGTGTTTNDGDGGTITGQPCTACPNAGGVNGWKTVTWAYKVLDDEGTPRGVCDDADNGPCDLGYVTGLCEINQCSVGYTLGTNFNLGSDGSEALAVIRVVDQWDGSYSECYHGEYTQREVGSLGGQSAYTIEYVTSTDESNCTSDYNGMNYDDWKAVFSSGAVGGISVCSSTYGSANATGTPNVSSAGKYCWCKATGYTKSSGNYTGELFAVSDTPWVMGYAYTNSSGCSSACAAKCAEAARADSSFRNVAFKDTQTPAQVVFDTVCSPNTYTIAYNLDGGTYGASHPTSAVYNEVFNVSNPTRSGYTFAGWQISGMDGGTHYYGSSASSLNSFSGSNTIIAKLTHFKNLRSTSGTVTFTARWCQNCVAGSHCTCSLTAGVGSCTYATGADSGYIVTSGSGTYAPQCTAINCPAGQYFSTTANACKACVAGSYSNGGSVTSCSMCNSGNGGYLTLYPGSTSSDCVACSNGNAVTSWTNPDYWYNGTVSGTTENTVSELCSISGCNTGYTLSSSRYDLDAFEDSIAAARDGAGREWINIDDSVYHFEDNGSDTGSALLGLTNPGQWGIIVNYNNGIIAVLGNSMCSISSATPPSTISGNYCWCKMTGFLKNNVIETAAVSRWVFLDEYQDCPADCAAECVKAFEGKQEIRDSLNKESIFGETWCQPNKIKLSWDEAGGTQDKEIPDMCYYGTTAGHIGDISPIQQPTRNNHIFLGWSIQ